MLIEQLFFITFAFVFFVYMLFKMIQYNDTNYVALLILQALGITLSFLEVLFGVGANSLVLDVVKYTFSIILPIAIIALEKRGTPLFAFVNTTKAKIYLLFDNRVKAKQALMELVTKHPENYQAHKMLAEIYEQEGGMRKAIDEYVQAISINKKDYDSYYKVAELLTGLDKKDEASEMLFNLIGKKPDYEKASELLGDILIEQERYKEAANVYQEALRRNPTSFELNYSLGIVYTMLNDFQNAKLYYEKAADFNSMVYNTKYSLAEIALIYKELEVAEKYFMECLEDDELAADSYYELAKISMVKGEKDIAIKYANTAIDVDAEKIVPKVKQDPIFIPILARISIPFNIEKKEEERKSRLIAKEVKAKEHLENTFEITRNLSYYKDIRPSEEGRAKTDGGEEMIRD